MRSPVASLIAVCMATFTLMPGRAAAPITSPQSKGSTITRNGIETTRNEDGSVLEVDVTGKGAVLCLWGLYEAVQAVAQGCHRGEDVALRAEVDRSVARTDQFILDNSNGQVTRADLAIRKAQGLAELTSQHPLCGGEAEKLYTAFRTAGPEALRRGTDDLLSVPRKPVMAPCL